MTNPYAAPSADMSQLASDGRTYEPKMLAINGRIGRLRYLAYAMVLTLGVTIAGALVLGILSLISPMFLMLAVVLYIPVIGISFVMAIRRLNDMNQSGWLSLLFLIPLVNFFVGLWLLFGPGTAGSNRFGPAPSPNSRAIVIMAWAGLALGVVIGIVTAVAMPSLEKYSGVGNSVEEAAR